MRLPGGRRGGSLSLSPRPARSSKGKDRRSCRGRARTVCLHRRGVAGGRRDSLSSGAGGEEGALSSKVAAGCGKKKKKKEVLAKYTLLLSHSCTWALSGAAPWFEATLGGSAQHCSLLGHPWVLPASPGAWCGCDGLEFLEFWESRGSLPLFPLPSSLLLAEVRV